MPISGGLVYPAQPSNPGGVQVLTPDQLVAAINQALGGTTWQLGGGSGSSTPSNLNYSADANGAVVTNSNGTGFSITLAGLAAGLMSPSQVTKLAGIEANATGDLTGAEIVALINATLGSTTWQLGGGGGGVTDHGNLTGLADNDHPQYALVSSLSAVATSGAYASLSGLPTLGTSAALNVAATGNAAAGQVVKGDDSRLSDARTPTAHGHSVGEISGLPTFGTAAALNVPPILGDEALATQVVRGDDPRMFDARVPIAHPHPIGDVQFLQDALNAKLNNSAAGAFGLTLLGSAAQGNAQSALGITAPGLAAFGTGAGQVATGDHGHAQLHNRAHSMVSAADHTASNWSLFYSNGSGQVVEIALGPAGQFLQSTGPSSAPTFAVAGGGGGGGSPGGTDTQIQYNSAGTFAGDADFVWDAATNTLTLGGTDTGIVLAGITAEPSAPAAGTGRLYAKNVAEQVVPKWVGPSGFDYILQGHLAHNSVQWWVANGNSTTISVFGAAAFTGTGTATTANVATTNIHTKLRRIDYLVTTAAATAVAGFRAAALQHTIGQPSAGVPGGFKIVMRWGPATGVATATNRAFAGMTNITTAPTDVEPSSITNIVGMGWDAADANIQIMHRGAGAVTKIDLGASFAVPTVDRSKMYELTLFSPNSVTQSVGWRVVDLGTGASASGVITTNLPLATLFVGPRGWMSVGGTSSVIGISFVSAFIESDF